MDGSRPPDRPTSSQAHPLDGSIWKLRRSGKNGCQQRRRSGQNGCWKRRRKAAATCSRTAAASASRRSMRAINAAKSCRETSRCTQNRSASCIPQSSTSPVGARGVSAFPSRGAAVDRVVLLVHTPHMLASPAVILDKTPRAGEDALPSHVAHRPTLHAWGGRRHLGG